MDRKGPGPSSLSGLDENPFFVLFFVLVMDVLPVHIT